MCSGHWVCVVYKVNGYVLADLVRERSKYEFKYLWKGLSRVGDALNTLYTDLCLVQGALSWDSIVVHQDKNCRF